MKNKVSVGFLPNVGVMPKDTTSKDTIEDTIVDIEDHGGNGRDYNDVEIPLDDHSYLFGRKVYRLIWDEDTISYFQLIRGLVGGSTYKEVMKKAYEHIKELRAKQAKLLKSGEIVLKKV